MKVLVAPDKFKGSLTAAEVASAVAQGLADVHPGLEVQTLPVADGGDGTVDAAVAAGFRRIRVPARGPTGEPVTASYAVHGDTAVVELAEASGLHRLPGAPSPLDATSAGTGDLIAAALRAGCRRIVLGVGGSACTDGGAGMLTALGARLLDAAGQDLPPGGASLSRLASLDLSELDLSEVDIELASDVDNPLYGPNGAAFVYGPQKGASPDDVEVLDTALRHWASIAGPEFAERPGAGAAGGVGFAAMAVLGARMRPGIDTPAGPARLRRRPVRSLAGHHRRGFPRPADALRQSPSRSSPGRGGEGHPVRRGVRPLSAVVDGAGFGGTRGRVRTDGSGARPSALHGRGSTPAPPPGPPSRRGPPLTGATEVLLSSEPW